MIRSITFVLLLVGATLLAFPLPAEDVTVTYRDVEVCLSLPPDPIPVWGFQVGYLVVSNRGQTAMAFLDPKVTTAGTPTECGGLEGDVAPPDWTTVAPGLTVYRAWALGSPRGGSLVQVGEHPFAVSIQLDFDADLKGDKTEVLESKYRVVEPPAEVLSMAQERGQDVELCERGGTPYKGIIIPWGDLENEQQARVRESIALPTPSMTPEEIAKRGGSLPMPSDPDDRKRLEDALKSDPAYLRWEALRAKIGLYAGFDYAATARAIDGLLVRRMRFSEDGFEAHWGGGPERRAEMTAMPAYRITLVCKAFLDKGKSAALEYLDALAKEELRCADRAFLEEVRAIVVAAPDNLTRSDVVYQQKGD